MRPVLRCSTDFRLTQDRDGSWIITFNARGRDGSFEIRIRHQHPESKVTIWHMDAGQERQVVDADTYLELCKSYQEHNDSRPDEDRYLVMLKSEHKMFEAHYIEPALQRFTAIQHLFSLTISF
jgi:hypothetical protein